MQPSARSCSLLLLLFTAIVTAELEGRCPLSGRNASSCPTEERSDDCATDDQCNGESICCSDGCRKLCILPVLTSCERQKVETMKRARALQVDENSVSVPKCDQTGDYETIQCDPVTGYCYCVDESGFELGGTRARSLELVNCTKPKPCAGLLCRMLCPYDFELDEEGCPLCQCRDPCRGIKCPGSETCQLEEVACLKEPCPPVPTCKQARSISSLCPTGVPMTMPATERPYLCGNQEGQPKCPNLFNCVVQPGNSLDIRSKPNNDNQDMKSLPTSTRQRVGATISSILFKFRSNAPNSSNNS